MGALTGFQLKAKLQTSQKKLIRYVGTAEFKEINCLPLEHRVAQIKLN